MYVIEISVAEIFDVEEVVAERLNNSALTTPTKTKFLASKEMFSGNQYIVALREVGQLSLTSHFAYALALLLRMLMDEWVKTVHLLDQIIHVDSCFELCFGDRNRVTVGGAQKGSDGV